MKQPPAIHLAALAILASITAHAGTIDPSQKDWYKRYQKQENTPEPGAMLLNVDKVPELKDGFTPLFNGKDLTGWSPKGGESRCVSMIGDV